MGPEISGSRVLIGSGGARLWRARPSTPKTFFFVQFEALEYLLVGDCGSFAGELSVLEE